MKGSIQNVIEKTLEDFCKEFVENPYLCYTEHGYHALFFHRLLSEIPRNERYINFHDEKICRIQKEYRTAQDLDKSRRQHWDISVIKKPIEKDTMSKSSYDNLPLNSAIEFGLNEGGDHLTEDIRRLSHEKSNVENGYAVHLYRISEGFSKRDISPRSSCILKKDDLLDFVSSNDVVVYFSMADLTGNFEEGVWRIDKNR